MVYELLNIYGCFDILFCILLLILAEYITWFCLKVFSRDVLLYDVVYLKMLELVVAIMLYGIRWVLWVLLIEVLW